MGSSLSDAGIVIIGAGEAGTHAAIALRERHYAGPVTLIGAEPHLPYERPPLSKAALTMAEDPQPAFIQTETALAARDIAHRAAVRVTAIDRGARALRLDDGTTLRYTRLLIATGARPRRLTLPGADEADVLYLRTFADAQALRGRIRPGARIAIIGGGFIGLEIAASACARGCAVTVVEMAPRILGRAVPAAVAALVAESHRTAGVTLIEGVAIEGIEPTPGGQSLRLADGRAVAADVIVVGIGAVPETALAEAAGLRIENGIRVDGRLLTEDADIFAAGDCCSFPHPLFGERRLRLEAWRNAGDQGRHVAGSLLGGTAAYAAVPWFWSDQHEGTLQVVGLPDEGDETVVRDPGSYPLFFHLKAGRLVGASAFGPLSRIGREIRLAEMLIEMRASPPRSALGDPAVKLKSLIPRDAAAAA